MSPADQLSTMTLACTCSDPRSTPAKSQPRVPMACYGQTASQYAMRNHKKPRSLSSVRLNDTSRFRSASLLFPGNHAFPSPFASGDGP